MHYRSNLPFTQIGGARIGYSYWLSINLTFPLAEIKVFPDSVQLTSFSSWKYYFSKPEIKSIKVYDGLFSRGIQISHTQKDFPQFIVFWAITNSNLDSLKQALYEAGHIIQDS